jgi:glutamate/tyrosine decarboxylase-like PLP-dependent enzyme
VSLLRRTVDHAERFLASLPDRPVSPPRTYDEIRSALDGPLPEKGEAPERVIDDLVAAAEPGIVATAGPRYFGFVVGGALPAALAADWLVATWDGPLDSKILSPAAQAIEDVAARWALEALDLPQTASVGFVTGATMASFVGLAAARHRVLADVGWNVEEDGLIGAPPVRVLVGEEVHAALLKALRMVGLGSGRVIRVPVDANGAMRAEALEASLRAGEGAAIVCAQSGNVNTGACDPLEPIADVAHAHKAWVHVDGAFGLWAAASPRYRHLVEGAGQCDSWAIDAHKWLNVPYDSALAIVADRRAHVASLSATAAYLLQGDSDDGFQRTPEMSRRGRQVPVYAALRSLGRAGLADLVERCCAHARWLAAEMEATPGVAVLNDVVLNQVLLRFADSDAATDAVIEQVQRDGTAWLGGTVWRGRAAARVSVSNWSTTEEDMRRLADALRRAHALASR